MTAFRSRFDYGEMPGTVNSEPSMTIQSEADSTSVEYALRRFNATGILGDPDRLASAAYLDVSDVQDFEQSCNVVARARQVFEALPSEERRKYGDSLQVYMESRLEEIAQVSGAPSPVVEETPSSAAPDAAAKVD
ncbi:minor capsid protein [Capybara microvirus Cap1_SP_209]|nr:minor capsid protein [Capybara microvirus Cap1_SP_209]